MLVMTMDSLTFAAGGVDTQIIDVLGNKQMSIKNKHEHIKSVTAITEVFGDGQKVSAVAVEYDKAIDTSKLKTSDFTVEGQTVTKVYANTAAAKASQGVNGQYVIVELSTTIASNDNGFGVDQGSGSGNGADGAGNNRNGNAAQGAAQHGNPPQGGPVLGLAASDSSESRPLSVKVAQSGDITTADRQTYKAFAGWVTNSKGHQPGGG